MSMEFIVAIISILMLLLYDTLILCEDKLKFVLLMKSFNKFQK